ncbi:MAG: hypothetical protein NTY38_10405, partial [Acidobacteria bacterium]|nr:hypothetical protein [Acidobacteriota bacterium]
IPVRQPDRENDEKFEHIRARAFRQLARRWPVSIASNIPSALKHRRVWLAAAAVLVLALFLRRTPEGTVSAASAGEGSQMDLVLTRHWQEMQDRIVDRAAVNLQDDFRSGLSDWRGRANWAREWKYDKAGFVRTGSLALYTPSMTLNNYTLEFLGQIERKGLGWVVRAEDCSSGSGWTAVVKILRPQFTDRSWIFGQTAD